MKSELSPVIELARDLVSRKSVTPEDGGCQPMLADRLQALGFNIEFMNFGGVTNLWARLGTADPVFCFAGHTDVVPTGPEANWKYPPFSAEIADGMLWGRGAADMKSSIAAMLVAVERHLAEHPQPKGSIAFLLTSDEEGVAVDGTVRVVQTLEARNEKIRWCLVGEPSSENKLGDMVKNGRRGSLSATLRVQGIQGHVAHPHRARNPIHQAMPALAELAATVWDQGNEHFPPTSFQISNIHAGTGATNVIPGHLDVMCNFRFSTAVTEDELKQRTQAVLDKHGLDYSITWSLSGLPFLTQTGNLLAVAQAAILAVTGEDTELSTGGGTSDGRFIAPTGADVIELGPISASIHKVDECVATADLDQLAEIYQQILAGLLA